MDPLTALGLVAAIVQLVEVGYKVVERLSAYAATATDEVPVTFRTIKIKLPLVLDALRLLQLRIESKETNLEERTRNALAEVVRECTTNVKELWDILERSKVGAQETTWERGLKALRSLSEDKKVKKIEKALGGYVDVLTLHQSVLGAGAGGTQMLVVNMSASTSTAGVMLGKGYGEASKSPGVGEGSGKDERYLREDGKRGKSVEGGDGRAGEKAKQEATVLLPFDRNATFVGREDVFEEIDAALAVKEGSQPKVALCGLGGIGKSQIALEYCFRTKEKHPAKSIFWVNAATPARFEESYKRIAQACRIAPADSSADVTLLVKQWLESHRPDGATWLLVVDNADDRTAVFHDPLPSSSDSTLTAAAYLPRCAHGALLFTTRSRDLAVDLASPTAPVAVGALSVGEGHELLRGRLPQQQYEADVAAELLTQLEYIPLAITQAVAFMTKRRKSTREYLTLFARSDAARIRLLGHEFSDHGRPGAGIESVARTWTLSFEWIRQREPKAADLLCLMSFFQRQEIPVELLRTRQGATLHGGEETRGGYDEGEEDGEEDDEDFDFEEQMGILCSFSLVEAHENGQSYDMHRLVQLATRWWLTQEGKSKADEWAAKAIASLVREFPASTHHPSAAYWPVCARMQPHAQLLLAYPFASPSKDVELARAALLISTGRYLNWRGAREEAVSRFRRSWEIRTRLLGPSHVNTLQSLGHLVWDLSHRNISGQEAEAPEVVVLGKMLVDRRREVLGETHRDTIDALSDYASALGNAGQHEESERLQREALHLSEEHLGPEDPDTLNCLVNLADILREREKFADAEEALRRVIPLQERTLGEDHMSVMLSLHGLASALWSQGGEDQQVEALILYRRALSKQRSMFGTNHWETLMTLLDYCDALDDLDDRDASTEIVALCKEALEEIQPASKGEKEGREGEGAVAVSGKGDKAEREGSRKGDADGNDYKHELVLERLRWYIDRNENWLRSLGVEPTLGRMEGRDDGHEDDDKTAVEEWRSDSDTAIS